MFRWLSQTIWIMTDDPGSSKYDSVKSDQLEKFIEMRQQEVAETRKKGALICKAVDLDVDEAEIVGSTRNHVMGAKLRMMKVHQQDRIAKGKYKAEALQLIGR